MKLSELKCVNIFGYANSGKDTFATMINEYMYGTAAPPVEHIRFSQPLKLMAGLLWGWDPSRLGDQDYKSEQLSELVRVGDVACSTRRQALQQLGTNVGREVFGPDIWVDSALRTAARNIQHKTPIGCQHAFVTDCRFINEYVYLHDQMGDVLNVRLRVGGESMISDHPSETTVDSFDADYTFVIERGDLTTMRNAARRIATEYLDGRDIPAQRCLPFGSNTFDPNPLRY